MSQPAQKVFIDTDMGCDDIVAICMALLAPEINVLGFSVVNGLAHVEEAATHLRRLLATTGYDHLPVSIGASQPSSGAAHFSARARAEADELPFLQELLVAHRAHAPAADAATLLYSYIQAYPRQVTLLCLGPLTNIAALLNRYGAQVLASLKQVVIMGGAFFCPGNVFVPQTPTERYAEYNIYIDPLAAAAVFQATADILVVGIDVTRLAPIAECREHINALAPQSPAARIAKHTLEHAAGIDFLYDPLTVGAVACPAIIRRFDECMVHVDTDPAHYSIGQTRVVDTGTTKVVLDLDMQRFYAVLRRLLQS